MSYYVSAMSRGWSSGIHSTTGLRMHEFFIRSCAYRCDCKFSMIITAEQNNGWLGKWKKDAYCTTLKLAKNFYLLFYITKHIEIENVYYFNVFDGYPRHSKRTITVIPTIFCSWINENTHMTIATFFILFLSFFHPNSLVFLFGRTRFLRAKWKANNHEWMTSEENVEETDKNKRNKTKKRKRKRIEIRSKKKEIKIS